MVVAVLILGLCAIGMVAFWTFAGEAGGSNTGIYGDDDERRDRHDS